MDESLYEEMWNTEQSHWWFVGRRRIVQSLVDRFATSRKNGRLQICEVGCGTGGNLLQWADDHDVIGVDMSEHALHFARKRLGSRVTLGSLPHGINLPRENYDVVLSTDVFEHIDDDEGAVSAALSLLRPGGILVATVPAYQWLYSARDRHHHHFRRYGKQQFQRLFDLPGVKFELLSFYNSLLFAPAAMTRLWSKWFSRNEAVGDLRTPNRIVNRLLTSVFSFEQNLLRATTLPFGLSLVAVVRCVEPVPVAHAA